MASSTVSETVRVQVLDCNEERGDNSCIPVPDRSMNTHVNKLLQMHARHMQY